MKTANYYPLSTSNYNSPKSLNIRKRFGWLGYGLYHSIMQKLAASEERAMSLSTIEDIAFEFQCDIEEIKPIIINYFDSDDKIFWSDELNEKLSFFDDKYSQQSAGGKTTASQMTAEERKEKARKAINTRWSNSNENTK
jgi:hypothetical protein